MLMYYVQIVESVFYLHDHKAAHRDIRPEKLKFMDSGPDGLRIADLGLSAILTNDTLLTTCEGCSCFAAPEVTKGTDISFEADLWSIGALAYFLLSGVLPFANAILFQQYQNIITGNIEFTPEFDEISETAKDFIQKLLVVDPKARMLAKTAIKHPWCAESEERPPGPAISRQRILDELDKRSQRRKYKPPEAKLEAETRTDAEPLQSSPSSPQHCDG
jgi:serine/threonine protein kinase